MISMKGLLFSLVTLFATVLLPGFSLFAQKIEQEEFGKISIQQLADRVSDSVRANPATAPVIVREAVASVDGGGGGSGDAKKRVFAVVAAAVAAAPGVRKELIVAAAAGAAPVFGEVAASAADSVDAPAQRQPVGVGSTQMRLGNIRVLSIQGSGVESVDAQGRGRKPKAGDFLQQGARVSTGSNSSVDLVFENGSKVHIGPDSEFSVEKFVQAPFEAGGMDYRNLKEEPATSSTQASLNRGVLFFEVAKLEKTSAYNIVTPVGVAGIRGTGGFASSQTIGASQPVGFGLFEGSAVFTTAVGQVEPVNQNQSIGVGGVGTYFAVEANPPGAAEALESSRQSMAQAAAFAVAQPFLGAPPPRAAPPDPIALLPPALQRALQQAASEGPEALLDAVQQLASQQPSSVAEIAAAAADLSPSAAVQVAAALSMAFPNQAPSISASVSIFIPVQAAAVATVVSMSMPGESTKVAAAAAAVAARQAASIALAVAVVFPSQAAGVAASVSAAVPSRAPSIAASVALAVPSQASAVAASVALVVPSQAAAVAAAVARAVPSEAAAVSAAVAAAVPSQASAVEAAVQAAVQGGDAGAPSILGATDASQNPAILPIPSPTPVPTPPPVSPSF
jgi:hypothetical protein